MSSAGNVRDRFYLWLAVALCATTIYGFAQTYFSGLLDSERSHPSIVHLHGWTFFLWYLLLPTQAFLIQRRNLRLHRAMGKASIVLASLMVLTGLVVVTVSISNAQSPDAGPFWTFFGPVILSTLILFAAFYSLALRNRRKPDIHKRFMIIASAAGIGAAAFRAIASIVGFHIWVPAVGIVASNLFIVAAIIHDYRANGQVHRVYWIGLSVCVLVEGAMFAAPITPLGPALNQLLAATGDALAFLYNKDSVGL